LNDLVRQRIECTPQGIIADIHNLNTDNLRTGRLAAGKRNEIFALGDQNRAGSLRISPDGDLAGTAILKFEFESYPVSCAVELDRFGATNPCRAWRDRD
jgi:hypothetical protein